MGLRGRAWVLRAVAQPPGSRTWAGPPLFEVAQRLFPATEVLFSPTGCLFPNRSPRPSLRIPLVSLKGTNTNTRTHAHNLSSPAHGCVPGFVAQVTSVAERRGWRVSTLGTGVCVIVGEEKCDPPLRVPCRGPRKAWRPRDGAVAGLLSLRWRPLASLRGAGRTRGRTWGKNVCFPVGREKTVLKWYVALR